MKKTFIYSFIALAATLSLTSCEDMFGDYLDKQPSNDLTEEEVFSDWSLAVQFHVDTYNFLRHGALRINSSWLDAATDLAECSYSSGGVRTSFNIGNYYSSTAAAELTDTWEHYYRAIRKCNKIINCLDDVPKDADLSDEAYEQYKVYYKAEARFLRAFFYWELFLRYGAVPLVTEVLDPEGDLLSDYVDRPTVKEYVVDFIMEELKDCEGDLLDYETGANSSYAGRISQPKAAALYSRVALYLASPRFSSDSGISWTQAAAAAKSFMTNYGSCYRLLTKDDCSPVTEKQALTNAWLATAYGDGNPEVIFYRNDVAIYWASISADTPVGEGGSGGLCPSQNLVDMFDMIDGTSPFAEYDETGAPVYNESTYMPTVNSESGYSDTAMWVNRDTRLEAAVLYHGYEWNSRTINVISGQSDNPLGNANATPTGYYVRKYIPEVILANDHAGNSYRLWTIIRYAEIMLNYAEALNEASGPSGEIYEILDELRERAGITGSVADREDLQSKDALRNFIRKERTVELCFEEHRWWDVRRWGVAAEALARPIYGIDVDADGNITRKVAQKRVFEDKMYLYPIPEAEYWKSGIENNPGWE